MDASIYTKVLVMLLCNVIFTVTLLESNLKENGQDSVEISHQTLGVSTAYTNGVQMNQFTTNIDAAVDIFNKTIASTEPNEENKCMQCNSTTFYINEICPSDSIAIPQSYPQCCNSSTAITSRCQCKPCQPTNCTVNESRTLITRGNDIPSTCCDLFQCIQNNYTCVYDNRKFEDGDWWNPDKCSSCHCEQGLVYCARTTCAPEAGCGFMFTPEDECCPVCGGCSSGNQVFMLNQTWSMSDGCFKCKCVKGRSKCITEHCLIPTCRNPKKLEGVCCPVCEQNDTYVTDINTITKCTYKDKLILSTCPLICGEFGYEKDSHGCLTCECSKLTCSEQCPHGQAVSSDVRRQCACKPKNCSVMTCSKMCVYGFEQSTDDGCFTCKCRTCPLLQCNQSCTHGFEVNSQGCPYCLCRSEERKITDISESFRSCVNQKDGSIVDHMEIYFDGCRQCVCLDGEFMCALLLCPNYPTCSSMTLPEGKCCPICSGSGEEEDGDVGTGNTAGSSALTNLCMGLNNELLPDGELIVLDECTRCRCYDGKTFCDVADCVAQLSNCTTSLGLFDPQFSIEVTQSCCASCRRKVANSSLSINAHSKDDRSTKLFTEDSLLLTCVDDNWTYNHGDIWIPNPCQICHCKSGVIYCLLQNCQELKCSIGFHKKGACCPFCLEKLLLPVCVFNNELYRHNDIWNISECGSCQCMHGQINCTSPTCPQLKCEHQVQGKCCPMCVGENNTSIVYNENGSIKISNKSGNPHIIKKKNRATVLISITVLTAMTIALLVTLSWRLLLNRAMEFCGCFKIFTDGIPRKKKKETQKDGKQSLTVTSYEY